MAIRILSSENITGNLTLSGNVIVTGGDLTLGTDAIASNINALGDVLIINVDSNTGGGAGANIQLKTAGTSQLTINNSSATFAGDVALTGGSLSITGDGSNAATLTESGSGILTIDAVSNIILDSDSGQIVIADGGTNKGLIKLNGDNLEFKSEISNGDIKFNGNDNGSAITALTLDMSAGGAATFAGNVTTGGQVTVPSGYSVNIGTSRIHSTDTSYLLGGNVGIGTTSPGRGLTIDKSEANAALTIIKNNTGNEIVYLGTGSSAGTDDPLLRMYHNGTENIRLYATGDSWINGGKVGIGTTLPQRPLHVNGTEGVARFTSTASGNNGFEVGIGTASQAFLWLAEDSYMQFATNNTQRMRIDSGGSVIIGDGATSGTPAADYRSLEIGRQGNTITGAPWKSNLYFSTNATVTAGSTAFTARYLNELPMQMVMEDGIFTWSNAVTPTAVGDTVSFNEKMRLNVAGNLGIGTTNPSARLDILTNSSTGDNSIDRHVRFRADNGEERFNFFVGRSGNSSNLQMYDSSEVVKVVLNTGDNSYFNGGNVGIGVTEPETPLHVVSNTTDNASTMLVQNSSTGDASIKFNISGDTYSIGIDNSDGDKFKLSYGAVGTSDRIVVDPSGNVGIGTNSPIAQLDVAGNTNQHHSVSTSNNGTWRSMINLGTAGWLDQTYSAGRLKVFGYENGNVNVSYCEYYVIRSSTGYYIQQIGTRLDVGNTHGQVECQVSGNFLQVRNVAQSSLGIVRAVLSAMKD